MADDQGDLSARCSRYKNMPFPLLDYMVKCLKNQYDKENNPQGIINMGTSENKVIADIVVPKLNEHSRFKEEYSYCGDSPSFREAVAAFFTRYMKPLEIIDPKNIVILNGGASAVKTLSATILDPGEAVLMPAPYYGGFDLDLFIENEVIRFPVYLSSEPHPETKMPFELTVNDLESALKKAKEQNITVRALLLCHPQNPLGIVYSERQILECMKFAERHKLHLISDEMYMLSIYKEGCSMKSVLAVNGPIHPDRLHVFWGFSKDFGLSGVRCAALYSRNQSIVSTVHRVSEYYSISLHLQNMLENLINDFDWLDNVLIPTNHRRLRECHHVVTEVLAENNIPVVPACSGLYVWIDLRRFLKEQSLEAEKELADLMMENKVYINPGYTFSSGEPGWFRVVIGSDPAMVKLGIDRVVESLKKAGNN